MDLSCPTCKKQFATVVTLKRHIAKLISCGVLHTCNICKKDFRSSYDLKRHIARKNPCGEVVNPELLDREVKLKVELEKTNRRAMSIECKEKNDREHNATMIELAKIKAKSELDKIDKQIELAKIQAETAKIKSESRILAIREEEGLKTARKEITPQIINNIEINAVHINIVNNISKKYMLVNELCANVNEMSKTWYHHIDVTFQKDDANSLFNTKTIKEMTRNILQCYLNSREYPKYHNIFYKKASDEFYGIMRTDDDKKEVRIIDFKNEMSTMLLQPLIKIYKMILSNKPKLSSYKESDNIKLQKYEDLTNHLKYISTDFVSLIKEAKHIFDEENIIGETPMSCDLFSNDIFSDSDDY